MTPRTVATVPSVMSSTSEVPPGLPLRPGVDAQVARHERRGQAAAGGQQQQRVGDPGDPHHQELAGADQRAGARDAPVAAERGDPELDTARTSTRVAATQNVIR